MLSRLLRHGGVMARYKYVSCLGLPFSSLKAKVETPASYISYWSRWLAACPDLLSSGALGMPALAVKCGLLLNEDNHFAYPCDSE